MFLPNQVMLIPLFLLVRNLNLTSTLLGTYFAMAMPMISSPFGIFLIKQFCASIPDELLDAAKNGWSLGMANLYQHCPSHHQTCTGFPGNFYIQSIWNFFMWHMVIASDKFQYTIPVGVSIISRTPAFGKMITDIGLTMAGGSFGAIFMIIFFIVFQQYFIRGIMVGAVKG